MERMCGECTLCCTVTRVPEFNKPERITCVYCTTNCSIYENRPESCRKFECEWVKGSMTEDMKPSKSHVMIEKLPGIPVALALTEPGYEETWRTDMVKTNLDDFYIKENISIVASDNMALLANGATPQQVYDLMRHVAKEMGVI